MNVGNINLKLFFDIDTTSYRTKNSFIIKWIHYVVQISGLGLYNVEIYGLIYIVVYYHEVGPPDNYRPLSHIKYVEHEY